jgi:hypothetical protein
MALVYEKVPEKDWDYFNSLNIYYEGKHVTANRYTRWAFDKEQNIYFTLVQPPSRDYGETYLLNWGKDRIYIYVETHPRFNDDGTRSYHWDIAKIIAPKSLKAEHTELTNIIRELSEFYYYSDPHNNVEFIIDNIAEPKFIEEV